MQSQCCNQFKVAQVMVVDFVVFEVVLRINYCKVASFWSIWRKIDSVTSDNTKNRSCWSGSCIWAELKNRSGQLKLWLDGQWVVEVTKISDAREWGLFLHDWQVSNVHRDVEAVALKRSTAADNTSVTAEKCVFCCVSQLHRRQDTQFSRRVYKERCL